MNLDNNTVISWLQEQLSPQKHICSSCGNEHNCSRDGCRVIRDAIAAINGLENARVDLIHSYCRQEEGYCQLKPKFETMVEIMKYYQEQASYRGNLLRDARDQLSLAVADLRRDASCETCAFQRADGDTLCEISDYDCKGCCGTDCVCKRCDDGNQWHWKGSQGRIYGNKLEQRADALGSDIRLNAQELKPIAMDSVRQYNSLIHQISAERGADK